MMQLVKETSRRLLAHVFVLLLAEEYPNIASQVVVVEIPDHW